MTQYSQSPLRTAIGSHPHMMFDHTYDSHSRHVDTQHSDLDAYNPLYIEDDDLGALRDSTNMQGYHLDDEGRFLASHEPPPPPPSAHAAVGVAIASPVVEKPIGQPAFLSPSVFTKQRTAAVRNLSSTSNGSRSSRSAEAETSTRPAVEDAMMTDVTSVSPPPSKYKHPDAIQLYDWYIAFQPAVNVSQYSLQADDGLSHWVQVAGKRYRTRDGRRGSPSSRDDECELWHSSLIAARISSRLVRTKSGGLYQLMGEPDEDMMRTRKGLSYRFVVGFQNGFPPTWNQIVAREAKRLGLTRNTEQKVRKVGRPRKSVVKQEQIEEQLAPPLPARGHKRDKRKQAVLDDTFDDDDDWQPRPSVGRRRSSMHNNQDDHDADEEDVEVVSPAKRRARKSSRNSNDDRRGDTAASVPKSRQSRRSSQLDNEEYDVVPSAGPSSSSPPRPRSKPKKLPRELLALSQTGLGRLVVVENAIMDSLEERRASLREQGRSSKRHSLPAHLSRENPQTPLSQIGMNSLHTPRSSSRKRTSAGRWWEVAPLKASALSKKADVGKEDKQSEKVPSPDPTPTRKERQAKRVTPETYVTSDLSDHFSDSSDAYQAHDTDSQSEDDEVVKTSTPPRPKKRGSTSPNTDPAKRRRRHSRMVEDLIDDEESEGERQEAEAEPEESDSDHDEGSEAHREHAEAEGDPSNLTSVSHGRDRETPIDSDLAVDQDGEDFAFADDPEPATELQRDASRDAETLSGDAELKEPDLAVASSLHEDEVEEDPQIESSSNEQDDADPLVCGTLCEESDANERDHGEHSPHGFDEGRGQEDAILDDGDFVTPGHDAEPEVESHAVASQVNDLQRSSNQEEHLVLEADEKEAVPPESSTNAHAAIADTAHEQIKRDDAAMPSDDKDDSIPLSGVQDERERVGSVNDHEDVVQDILEPKDDVHEAGAVVFEPDEEDSSATHPPPDSEPAHNEPTEVVADSVQVHMLSTACQPRQEVGEAERIPMPTTLEDVAADVTGLTLTDAPTDTPAPITEQQVEQRDKTASPVLVSLDEEMDDEVFHDVSEDFAQFDESPVKPVVDSTDVNMLVEEKALHDDAPEVQFLNSVDSHDSIQFHKPSMPLKHADFDADDRWPEVESELDSYEDDSDDESQHFARDTYYFSD